MMAPVPNTTTTSPVDTITDSRKEASAAFRAKRKAKRIEREVAGQDVVSVHQKQKQTLTNSAVVVPVPVPVTSSAVPAHPPLPPPLQQAVGNKRELRAVCFFLPFILIEFLFIQLFSLLKQYCRLRTERVLLALVQNATTTSLPLELKLNSCKRGIKY